MFTVDDTNGERVCLSGTLAGSEIVEARSLLEQAVEAQAGSRLELNLAGLESYNSQVLSLCLSLLRKAQAVNVSLSFSEAPTRLFNMARVGGLEFIFSDER